MKINQIIKCLKYLANKTKNGGAKSYLLSKLGL